MKQFDTTILTHKKISPDYYELTFLWEHELIPSPGHFFTLSGWKGSDPLLRRPFAFSDFSEVNKSASMIYQLRGKATSYMTGLKKGDTVNILGPLGTTFPESKGRALLAGGGIGTGPMVFLANQLARKGENPLLLLGYRDKSFIPELNLEKSVELVIATDDGSLGFHGNVVDYLKSLENQKSSLYCCGPHPMLKACHDYSLERDIPCFVSMEEIMACGIGACQGCAIEVTLPQKYLRVCKEGPVFDSRIIKWI